MMKYLLAASAVALVAASSAQAAPVAAAPAFSWQGFYVGGQIGGSWSDTDYKVREAANTNANGAVTEWEKSHHSPDADGFIGGIYAGYNFDISNNIILGVETDFVWSDMEDSSRRVFNDGAGLKVADKYSVKQKWQGATRLRAAYAIDRFLPYISAGVAYGRLDTKNKFHFSQTGASGIDTSESHEDTFVGWTIGAGFDYAVTNNIIARLEYRYTDLGDKTFTFNGNDRHKIDYKTNDIRVGVAYKF